MNTLVNIVKGGTSEQRRLLMISIQSDGASASSAYAYVTGARVPMLLYQLSIQKHVKRIYDKHIPVEELFPTKE